MFYVAREAIEGYVPSPNVKFIWGAVIDGAKRDLAEEFPIAERGSDSEEWLGLYKLLRKYDPSFLRKASTQADIKELMRMFSECRESLGDPCDYCEEAASNSSWVQTAAGLSRFSTIYEDLSKLSIVAPKVRKEFEEFSDYLEAERQRVEEQRPEEEDGYYDDDDYSSSSGDVDVDSLFKDL